MFIHAFLAVNLRVVYFRAVLPNGGREIYFKFVHHLLSSLLLEYESVFGQFDDSAEINYLDSIFN